LIYLNEDEQNALWNALAAASLYYREHDLKDKEKELTNLLKIANLTERIGIEISREGLTGEGVKELQVLLRNRKKGEKAGPANKIIQFPRGKMGPF